MSAASQENCSHWGSEGGILRHRCHIVTYPGRAGKVQIYIDLSRFGKGGLKVALVQGWPYMGPIMTACILALLAMVRSVGPCITAGRTKTL